MKIGKTIAPQIRHKVSRSITDPVRSVTANFVNGLVWETLRNLALIRINILWK